MRSGLAGATEGIAMKLSQNQVWKRGEEYLRIVWLDRREVRYKVIHDLLSAEGEHLHVSKKEFCRLIKDATLLSDAEVRASWLASAGARDQIRDVLEDK